MIAGNNNNSRKDLTRASKLDFNTKKGDTFRYEFETFYVNELGEEIQYDFDSCTIKMHIKKHPKDKKPYIVCPVSAVNNTMTMYIPANTMNDVDAGVYYYDLELFDAEGYNYTLLYGRFNVKQDVTFFGDTAEVVFDLNKLYNKLIYNVKAWLKSFYSFSISGIFDYTKKEWMQPSSLDLTMFNDLFWNRKDWMHPLTILQKIYGILTWDKIEYDRIVINFLIGSNVDYTLPVDTLLNLSIRYTMVYTLTTNENIAE